MSGMIDSISFFKISIHFMHLTRLTSTAHIKIILIELIGEKKLELELRLMLSEC